jgi:hypothetical protein
MTKAIINRDFSHYQTLQGHKAKVNGFSAISQSPLSLVRSQPIFIKPYSTKPLAIEGHSKVSILTLDLETRTLLNGQLEVISSALYDGQDYHTFYLTDFINQEELLIATVKLLTNPLYNGYQVYIHNLSLFDGIFLFKYILALDKEGFVVTFLKREDKFISITICKYEHKSYFNKKGELKSRKVTTFKLTIYDSLLLLPNSLSKLAKAFNVLGKVSFDVTNNDTALLTDPIFRSNLLEYNKQDCKVLYDVMVAFNQSIDNLFKMSIFDSSTLPGLAFKLFKTKFLKDPVEITWYEDYLDYKEAYRGGAVDVYKPHGHNLYYYDVNSLYPYAMKTNLYPVGESYYFEGPIGRLDDMFGIVLSKITAPDNLYAPILLTKDVRGRTLAPIGSWTGWYCSEELKLAVKYGYQVEVIKGYHWVTRADLLLGFKESLRILSISIHNWLFNDDLISKDAVEKVIESYMVSNQPLPGGLMNRVGIYVSYAYDYASGVTSVPTYLSQYINWSYAGYTCASLLKVNTS